LIEALIAFVAAVLIIAVFQAPAWALKLGSFGGLAFSLYVLILVVEWIIGKLPPRGPRQ
jgi:uncharacterized membrane protein YjjB (DUF3815 family)